MKRCFVGIDVQVNRDCCYAIIDDSSWLVNSGWFSNIETGFVHMLERLSESTAVEVGIDAPRIPLNQRRQWYWNGSRRRWERRSSQKGYGRHCEIVVSAHGIARPQWTPVAGKVPGWMQLGFNLFSILENIATVHEVFPTASYSLLQGHTDIRINADFSACNHGPKDMLDAWVAAVTVSEFVGGRGTEVGGGDGLGTIILPRPLPPPVIEEVLNFPRVN